MTSAESTAIFTDSWSLYDLITEHNYMFHREIYAGVGTLLKLRNDMGRFSILDLGCGNARYLAPCLVGSNVEIYEGVDVSELALSEAHDYLAEFSGQVVLRHGDLLQAVESTDKKWDVLFTGFALHHLMPQEKRRFFRAVERCLSQNGWLIIVDVVREENQDRTDYLDDYLKLMRTEWIKIPSDRLEEACAHVRDHDYPECLSTLKEMAKTVSLSSSCVISRYAQHHTLLFSRSDW